MELQKQVESKEKRVWFVACKFFFRKVKYCFLDTKKTPGNTNALIGSRWKVRMANEEFNQYDLLKLFLDTFYQHHSIH